MTRSTPAGPNRRSGFSIVELLVVVAIIVALIGILVVALNTAARRAQAANTQFLLSSIGQALVRFEQDIGYLPPVLGRAGTGPSAGAGLGRDLLQPPPWTVDASTGVPTAQAIVDLQNWFSYTTLPEYLLGYGDRFADGYGAMGSLPPSGTSPGATEIPLLGIRSPGRDGVWGALINPLSPSGGGRFVNRNNTGFSAANVSSGNAVLLQGRVYGPYLDLKEDAIIAGLVGFDPNGEPILARPGEQNYSDNLPKVFVDYWGSPIHYYRKAYAFLDLKGPDPTPAANPGVRPVARDLGDIFALRPFEFRPGEEAVGVADASGDSATLTRLKAANWALMSRGADKSWTRDRRRDSDEFNRDNIVEVGQ
jgi:type II secretory pathway pseudopilin PulG